MNNLKLNNIKYSFYKENELEMFNYPKYKPSDLKGEEKKYYRKLKKLMRKKR